MKKKGELKYIVPPTTYRRQNPISETNIRICMCIYICIFSCYSQVMKLMYCVTKSIFDIHPNYLSIRSYLQVIVHIEHANLLFYIYLSRFLFYQKISGGKLRAGTITWKVKYSIFYYYYYFHYYH